MSSLKRTSYARILKTSSILGASSLIDILLRIVRTKILAMQLGPALFGTLTLYTGLIGMITSVSSLGIAQSAVREIAKASATNDTNRIALVTFVLRKIIWGTGFLGLIITVCLAYPASWWMFDNTEHIWAIAVLGLVVLFSHLNAGQISLLSGLRLISDVARANILGSFLGTLMAIPLLLWLSEKGIVPFLLAISAGQLVASWWYVRRKPLPPVRVKWRECIAESSDMLRLGLVLMVSGVALSVSSYLIRLVLQTYLGEASVGIYQAAYTVSGIYVGFVLQAMSGDFFPHLTAISDDKNARNQLVNEQMEIAILIAVPGLVALLLFSDVLLWVLYSDRFIGGTEILRWQILGMLGRIISWPMGFILLARSDKVSFIISEVFIATAHIFFVWMGVQLYGMKGAGMAFALEYILHVFMMIIITKVRHEYTWEHKTIFLVFSGTILLLFAFGSSFISDLFVISFISDLFGSFFFIGLPVNSFFSDLIIRYSTGGIILLITIFWSIRGFYKLLGKEKIYAIWSRLLKKMGFA